MKTKIGLTTPEKVTLCVTFLMAVLSVFWLVVAIKGLTASIHDYKAGFIVNERPIDAGDLLYIKDNGLEARVVRRSLLEAKVLCRVKSGPEASSAAEFQKYDEVWFFPSELTWDRPE